MRHASATRRRPFPGGRPGHPSAAAVSLRAILGAATFVALAGCASTPDFEGGAVRQEVAERPVELGCPVLEAHKYDNPARVTVRFLVNEQGRVMPASVSMVRGHHDIDLPRLDERARDLAVKCSYTPAKNGQGQPVEAWVTRRFLFPRVGI